MPPQVPKNGSRKAMGYIIPILLGELFLVGHGALAIYVSDHYGLKEMLTKLPLLSKRVDTIDLEGGVAFNLHLRDEQRSDDKVASIDKKIDRNSAKVDQLTESMTQVLVMQQQLKTMLEEDRRNRPD